MSKIDIDICPSKRPQVFEMLKEEFGRNKCLNIITFKTETLKSAIKTACRGLGIDGDLAQEMSNLVPITRGRVWTLTEVLKGNADNGFTPVTALVNKITQFDNLLETIQEIEGLISGRGSHASGFYIFDKPYIEMNALMKAPSGLDVTCWEMEDSDLAGALKFDILVTDAVEKIQKSMELLLDDHLIEWQGSLKDTYDKYFHPDALKYTDPQMWDYVGAGSIVDLFQFMSDVGIEAIRKIKPRSLKELAVTSSIMRLMGDADETPIDRYVSFKSNINLWYDEMKKAGLNEDEISVLRNHLESNSGCSVEQEDVMEISMDENISGFNMGQADTLRKIIGKKKIEKLPAMKKMFFEEGANRNSSKALLEYVWNKCIMVQAGYAFARPHVLAYAIVALQEMNIFTYFPHIYWQCAVLSINAAANEDDDSNKTTNYGKIAKAIGDMSHKGVKFALPSVERARFGFSPDTQTNSIVFGLKAINGVGDDAAAQIVRNRPYSSLDDFYTKNADFSNGTMIALIKAGALDELGKPIGDRYEIMKDFILRKAKESCPPKDKLTMQNYKSIAALNIIPAEFSFICELIHFKAYTFSKEFMLDKETFSSEFASRTYFENKLYKFFTEGVEYYYEGDELRFLKKGFDKFFNSQITPLKEWLALPSTVEQYNRASVISAANALWMKSCVGTIPRWEMESLSFYYTDHELSHVNTAFYNLSNFSSIPSDPVVVGTQERKGKSWDKYQLYRIAGAILDKNKNHHTITLLTTDGVVTVKFYAEAFAFYDKQISRIKDDGKKEVLEKSWFSRGNLLLVTGIRRGDNFFPKKYSDSIYQHTVCLIKNVYDNGYLEIQNERVNPNIR